MPKLYDVWVPPTQRPITVGPPATCRHWWRKEFSGVSLRLGRQICRLYHTSERDAQMLLTDGRYQVGKSYQI